MMIVRQNATHKVVIGPVVAVGDGFTPVTTLSLSTADEAEAILHDNATVVSLSGYTFAAITTADGYYHLTLQSGITSTIGHMTVVINDDSLCLPVKADFQIVEESVYDNFYASSAVGPLTAAQVNTEADTAITDAALATAASLATAQADLDTLTGTDGVTLATSQPNYAPSTHAALDVWHVAASSVITASTIGLQLKTNVDAVLSNIEADTQDLQTQIGTAGAGLTDLGGMSTTMKAQVESEANDALVAIHLDHLLAVDYDPASKPGVSTALLNEMIASDAGVSQWSTNALENAPGGSGSDPWSTALPGAYNAGEAGYIVGTFIDAAVSSVSAATQGDWAITRTYQLSGGAKVANVRMSLVEVSGKLDTTTTDGIATVKANNGSYTLRTTVPFGYEPVDDEAITISGADDVDTVTLTPTSADAPSSPSLSTLVVLCLDEDGEPEEGVEIDIRIESIPSGSTNISFDSTKQTATSTALGIATLYAVKGATYGIKRGRAESWDTITIGEDDTTSITSFIGSP